jgi:hypothetical protein
MPWLGSHRIAVGVVAAALIATAGLFALARPAYHARVTEKLVDMRHEDHYRPAEVMRAFATQGIALVRVNHDGGTSFYKGRHLGPADDSFLVTLIDPNVTVGFETGTRKIGYEQRLGNLDVSFGWHDDTLVGRIKAAMKAVKH